MGIPLQTYRDMLARLHPAPQPRPMPSVERESDLHEQIATECLRRGWLAFHGSMAHKTHRTPGEPDFVILRDNGRLLLVEAKARREKPTTEQLGVIAWAHKLGHVVHVVRSFEEFLAIILWEPSY